MYIHDYVHASMCTYVHAWEDIKFYRWMGGGVMVGYENQEDNIALLGFLLHLRKRVRHISPPISPRFMKLRPFNSCIFQFGIRCHL